MMFYCLDRLREDELAHLFHEYTHMSSIMLRIQICGWSHNDNSPDGAFPATDVGLLRGAASLDGLASTSIALLGRAECWRPGVLTQHSIYGMPIP